MGSSIGISLCFQYASYRYHGQLFFKDKVAVFIVMILILYGFTVTSLDLIDCFLLAIYGKEANPMKFLIIDSEESDIVKKKWGPKYNGVYRVNCLYLYSESVHTLHSVMHSISGIRIFREEDL